MLRGLYTAASGMIAETVRNDAIANNLANAATAGYKKDVAVTKNFADMLITRIQDGASPAQIGSLGAGSLVDAVVTEHTGGSLKPTGNDFDLAISGKGFFAIGTPNGVRYTRNGSFTRSAQGELTTLDGNPVLGQNGPIQLPAGKLTVSPEGRVMVNNIEVARLELTDFADTTQLTKEGASLFAAGANAQTLPVSGTVQQGMQEQSNVNVVEEMVNMIAGYRAYEVNAKAVQAQDELLDKAVNQVGQV